MTEDQEAWLEGHIQAHVEKDFAWGRRDCTTMAVGWIDHLSGTDELSRVRGQYRDLAGALRWQRANESLRDGMARHGWRRHMEPPATGDIVLGRYKGVDAASICYRGACYSMDPELGFTGHNLAHLVNSGQDVEAWRHG